MALTVGELVGYLRLDTTRWDRALARARKGLREFGPHALKASESVGKVTSASVTAAGALGLVGNAGVAAVGALAMLPGVAVAGGAAMATLKVATSGFGEAMKNLGDPEAFAEALKELSPNAQATAKAVRDLVPQWDKLTDAVQDAAFAGVSGQVRDLGGKYIPVLRAGMTAIATGFNRAALDVGAFLGEARQVRTVESIMGSSAVATGNLAATARPLISIFLDLSEVGSRLFAEMTGGAGAATQRLADMVAAARESGALERFMRGGIEVLRQLWTVARNVGTVLVNIFRAASPNGEAFLSTLVQLTGQMAAWAQSAQGQEQIAAVFSLLAQVAGHLGSVLPLVASVVGTLASAFASLPAPVQSVVAGVLAWITVIGLVGARLAPLIMGLTTLGGKFLTAATTQGTATNRMLAAMGRFAGAVAAWIANAVRMAVTTAVQFAVMAARSVASLVVMAVQVGAQFAAMAARAVASMAVTAAQVVAQWAVMAAGAMARAVIMAASWVVAMGPIGWVIAAVVGLVALIVANWDTVVSWTQSAWSAVSEWVSTAWQWCVETVQSAGRSIVEFVTNAWNSARDAVHNGVSSVVAFVRSLPGRILDALGNLGSLLVDSGRALLQGLWDGISGAVGWLKGKVSGVLSSIRNLFPFSPAKEGPFSGSGYTTFSGRALITDFAQAIAADGAGAVAAAHRVAGQVRSALAPGGVGLGVGVPTVAAPAGLAYTPPSRHTTNNHGDDGESTRPIRVDELRDALAGMSMVLDDTGGRVLARVVNRAQASNRRR